MKVSLSLKTQKFVSIDDVLFVEDIRIAQFVIAMVEIYKVRRASTNVWDVLEELLNWTIYPDCYKNYLTKLLCFNRVQTHTNLDTSFQIRRAYYHVL